MGEKRTAYKRKLMSSQNKSSKSSSLSEIYYYERKFFMAVKLIYFLTYRLQLFLRINSSRSLPVQKVFIAEHYVFQSIRKRLI